MPSAAVADGHGGLLTSGSNAPLFTSSFIPSQPKAKEGLEIHERRLARALDIDRATRVHEYRDRSLTPRKVVDPETKSIWTGSEWEVEGLGFSKLTVYACCI
jgi:hypothetical protein